MSIVTVAGEHGWYSADVIDSLELRIPAHVRRRHDFWQTHRQHPTSKGPYLQELDARRSERISVFWGCRNAPASRQHYKVVFTDAAFLTGDDFQLRIRRAFELSTAEVLQSRVARIDFAADVYGADVDWFRRHMTVAKKQSCSDYQSLHGSFKKGFSTLMFGSGNDLYRVYDKTGEKIAKEDDPILPKLPDGTRVARTRVERQCRGRSVPTALNTLGLLLERAATFDPYDSLVLGRGTTAAPETRDWTPQKWLGCLGLKYAVETWGEAEVRARLRQKGAKIPRIFNQYSDMLRVGGGPTRDYLVDLYRRSTVRQLNMPILKEGRYVYEHGFQMML